MYFITEAVYFPPPDTTDECGIIAIGGVLSTERLLLAYASGIFPWYNDGDPVIWWCPDPRCVLFPHMLHISKSMAGIIKKKQFSFSFNTAFKSVMHHCRLANRGMDGEGTWINDEMEIAYNKLHNKGFAHSAEAWHNGKLVGGLYGVQIENIFFGESMFSLMANASKFAFINLVQQLSQQGVTLIDCQVESPHLKSLGAVMITRPEFLAHLEGLQAQVNMM